MLSFSFQTLVYSMGVGVGRFDSHVTVVMIHVLWTACDMGKPIFLVACGELKRCILWSVVSDECHGVANSHEHGFESLNTYQPLCS